MNNSEKTQMGAVKLNTAMEDIINRLKSSCNKLDGLTLDLNNKLQAIKVYSRDEKELDEVEKKPECVVDEINILISRINEYNYRLESSLNHLNQIV